MINYCEQKSMEFVVPEVEAKIYAAPAPLKVVSGLGSNSYFKNSYYQV